MIYGSVGARQRDEELRLGHSALLTLWSSCAQDFGGRCVESLTAVAAAAAARKSFGSMAFFVGGRINPSGQVARLLVAAAAAAVRSLAAHHMFPRSFSLSAYTGAAQVEGSEGGQPEAFQQRNLQKWEKALLGEPLRKESRLEREI